VSTLHHPTAPESTRSPLPPPPPSCSSSPPLILPLRRPTLRSPTSPTLPWRPVGLPLRRRRRRRRPVTARTRKQCGRSRLLPRRLSGLTSAPSTSPPSSLPATSRTRPPASLTAASRARPPPQRRRRPRTTTTTLALWLFKACSTTLRSRGGRRPRSLRQTSRRRPILPRCPSRRF